ncbi:DnaJ domain-containing protein [Spiroplasma turonicum]|uniref:J domain-containing protein n=1 Tax=Spiroplasma turonicum TaxID=216946 RepID=A0A0K1P8G3_9MOLU|nr:DnaJ domain-containing protein [Spiroplasma turonicum]AKU80192.1 hypothetical protein STURON_00946 [Spiroplasma turonicum]ALX71192.1 hypothetical protein STURO_v1c09410 [Spiroplasma turonicum]
MGWKKEFKKLKKEFNKSNSVFDYSDGVSSIIAWERSMMNASYWNIDNLLEQIEFYNEKIKELLSVQKLPTTMNSYEWKFGRYNITEHFVSLPAVSYFSSIYDYLSTRLDSYSATVIIMSLTKFTYYTTIKFWKVFNFTFSNKDIDDEPLKKMFEIMQRTALDTIDAIIEKSIRLVNDRRLDAYKNHLIIEEIIDLGDENTYHWSKMLDQSVDIVIETYMFQNNYGTSSSTSKFSSNFFDDDNENFDDFFEKTKTIVFHDEVNEAFSYFGLTKFSKPEEFKKIYRKFAKQFHPDVNQEPYAAVEMKKINVFKTIIEQYFDKYAIS